MAKKSIFTNRRNKYNNKHKFAVVDNKGETYPFDSYNVAEMFAKQNFKEYEILKFDSTLERDRFLVLKKFENKGVIKDLKCQVKFELIPSQKYEKVTRLKNGIKTFKMATMRPTAYYADFTYYEGGMYVVEDTKSPITRKKPEYSIKKKLMLLNHNIVIKEVMKRCINTL